MTFRRQRKISRRRFLSLGGAGLTTLALGNTFWYEPRAVEVQRVNLPTGQKGRVRMVQISDLHLSEFNSYFQKVAEQVLALKPDLIVLTGDYLEEERNIRGVLSFLRQLKAPLGIFAVQGNWEYWSRLEGENLRRHFAGAGAQLLINERRDVTAGATELSILGLDYPSTSDRLNHLQGLADPVRFNVLLSHVPAFAHELLNASINLVLSGHTHGGQVRLPALPPVYLPRYSGRFVQGLYRISESQIPLYVNRGIGTSILPMRLCCRPEITLFELGD